jgi:hypothetical protein
MNMNTKEKRKEISKQPDYHRFNMFHHHHQ